MERLRKTYYKDKEILIVDYSDCSGDDLIRIFEQARQLALTEKKQYLVLTIFSNNTYVSPGFIRHIENEILTVDEFIDKQVIVGLSQIQEWILKGINLWYKRQIYAFNSIDEALEFLVKDD